MKEIINSEKIYFYLLIICSFGIGLQSDIYKYAIIALLLQWLLSFDFSNKFQKLKQNKFALLLIIFYVFYAISFFWSDNIPVSLTDLLLKIPILLFPLILASSRSINKDQINKILLVFCLSSLFINFYAFGNGYLNYLKNGNINSFYYYKITYNMHSAYQAMFTCFSISLLIYLRIRERFIPSWLMYFGVITQLLFVLLLSSRMQILIIILLIPSYFIMRYYQKRKLYLGVSYIILIFSFGYLFISIPSALNYRYKETIRYINPNHNPRKFIWEEGLKVIKDNWFFGVGNGDAKDKLIEKYSAQILEPPISDKQLEIKNNAYILFVKRGYNYHNQYLQTFSEIGLFGILLLLMLFGVPFIQFLLKKEYFKVVFLFIIGASFLTESMLERQAGVAFVSFFYTLLIILRFTDQNSLNSSV